MSRCVITKEVNHNVPHGRLRGYQPEIEDHFTILITCLSLFLVARIVVSSSLYVWIILAGMFSAENRVINMKFVNLLDDLRFFINLFCKYLTGMENYGARRF